MEFDHHTTNIAVRRILDQLVADLPGYRWERICTFSDGKEMTIMEVSVYRKGGSVLAARLSYQAETGQLLDFHYHAFEGPKPDTVIDLLLDIRNIEHARRENIQE